jgi:serine/threonine-protein kinase
MPETLGPYTLDKRIGAGGMADVFLARGPKGVCVIKRPHPHLCANPDFVRMFLDEAAILASLRHPNIAEIFDLGQVDGSYYLAMEYVPGFDLMTISLEHERQGELMAPELCARIVADVAGALHSAHEAKHPKTGQALNLIHRDVSPHNILLSTTGIVKLIDFGVARAATATHRTQAGLVKGKYPYMAPEQVTGQDIDRRVDVFAMGLVFYELLTNTRAIAGSTEIEQIDNARSARIRPIEQLRPNLSLPLRQILASCVHPERDGRYSTALALKEDLEKYLQLVAHPVGQEDLLRLFRVVAAEVAHLEPQTPPQLPGASAPNTWGGARTEEEMPTGAPGEEDASAFAPTAPSMRTPTALPLETRRAPASVPENSVAEHVGGTGPAPVAPAVPPSPPRHAALRAIGPALHALQAAKTPEPVPKAPQTPASSSARLQPWIALATVAVIGLGAFSVLRGRSSERNERTDSKTTSVAMLNPKRSVDDAAVVAIGATVDAGARADERAATVDVESDLPMSVWVEGHDWGKTPAHLELTPGRHVIELKNAMHFCDRRVEVELAPGASRSVQVRNPRGTLVMRVEPGGEFSINGRKLPGFTAFKETSLCEGQYNVTVAFSGYTKKKQVEVSAGNTVEANFGLLTQ